MSKKRSKRRYRKTYTSRAKQEVKPTEPEPDLEEEYRYVLVDLRSMGVLAASMFALLVILALLLG